MNWYTKENGVIYLGLKTSQFAQFNIVTEVISDIPIDTSLTQSHIELIGSFPEDWSSDSKIEQKINSAAKHYFGLSTGLTPFNVA